MDIQGVSQKTETAVDSCSPYLPQRVRHHSSMLGTSDSYSVEPSSAYSFCCTHVFSTTNNSFPRLACCLRRCRSWTRLIAQFCFAQFQNRATESWEHPIEILNDIDVCLFVVIRGITYILLLGCQNPTSSHHSPVSQNRTGKPLRVQRTVLYCSWRRWEG